MPTKATKEKIVQEKIKRALHEYETGKTLSNGKKIKSRAQAVAIGVSEGMAKIKKLK